MKLNFEKWHGCKNDFLVVWLRDTQTEMVLPSLINKAPDFCNRDGSGVGADGILVLHQPNDDLAVPETLTIINSDGSVAANCGNGLRVAALSVRKACFERPRFAKSPEMISLKVQEKVFDLQFLLKNENEKKPLVSINMGVAQVGADNSWHSEAEKRLSTYFNSFSFTTVDLGNLHIVLKTDDFSYDEFLRIGEEIQKSKFWDGINFHWIIEEQPESNDQAKAKELIQSEVSEKYKVYCYERGVGPTQACGSGATAVGCFATTESMVAPEDWVQIDMPGGRLYTKSSGDEKILAGPGTFVYSGEIDL